MDRILFFDGQCIMCNGLVDFVMKHDQKKIFKCAPLQGNHASKLVPTYTKDLNTAVLLQQGKIYTKSDAILRLLVGLGGFYKLAYPLLWMPKFLRDSVYNFIAKNRYRIFGKSNACRLPTKEEKERLLD